ncbi:hypothetical protein [Lutibacter oricola]|nr:hypothetical protein [Lutibacter oricola]
MRNILGIIILTLLMINCSNHKKDLVFVKNDYEIDLTNIDSVCKNLKGFWIPEKLINGEMILWLDMNENNCSCNWEIIPFNDKIRNEKMLPMKSCPTVATLIDKNNVSHIDFGSTEYDLVQIDSVHFEYVGLGGSSISKIEYLSKTKFKINGITYLRHKGYEFLE